MYRPLSYRSSRKAIQVMLAGILMSLALLISACGTGSLTQQQADQAHNQLTTLLRRAQAIGVPTASLQPIELQKNKLDNSRAPFSLFNDQAVSTYYDNIDQRYQQLVTQTQGIIATSTESAQSKAMRDVQNFQMALARERNKGSINVSYFSNKFSADQKQLSLAQSPKDFAALSRDTQADTDTLNQIQPTMNLLNYFNQAIGQLQDAKIDATGMQQQYQLDLQTLNGVKSTKDIDKLTNLIDAQYQQTVVTSNQALPYVGAAKLREFQSQINLLKSYGSDTTSDTKAFDADQASLNSAKNAQDYQNFTKKVNADMAKMTPDLIRGGAGALVQQFHHEVTTWSNAHMYHDPYDGGTYPYTAGYDLNGTGGDLDVALSQAYTTSDYQSVLDQANNALFDLHMLEANFKDKTPYNQVHATDKIFLQHYNLMKGQVLLVSLTEQSMRIFQDGKLVRSYYVTTGRYERPSEPGVWTVLDRRSPTKFVSSDPKSSPFWYPPTPINYAILYNPNGSFVHDATWRTDFGPGTQFPHADGGAPTGSHGCVNLPLDEEAWVYNNTNWNTIVALY